MNIDKNNKQASEGRNNSIFGAVSVILLIACAFLGISTFINAKYTEPFTLTSFINGNYISACTRVFDNSVPIREFAVRTLGKIRYLLFREGQKGILIGDKGVLFTDEEYEPFIKEYLIEENVCRFIGQIDRELRKRGVEVIIIPLPSKSRILKDYLHRYPAPAHIEERYSLFLTVLSRLETQSVDLLSIYKDRSDVQDLFYKTDTHWTSLGAKLAAEAAAEVSKTVLNHNEYKIRDFEVLKDLTQNFRGDLLQYVPGITSASGIQLFETYQSINLYENNPPVTGLFDAVEIPFALVGTSFSYDSRWGFEDFLKQELKADLINLSDEGKGPFLPMQEFMNSDYIEVNSIKVVFWEIPERYLPVEDILSFLQDKR